MAAVKQTSQKRQQMKQEPTEKQWKRFRHRIVWADRPSLRCYGFPKELCTMLSRYQMLDRFLQRHSNVSIPEGLTGIGMNYKDIHNGMVLYRSPDMIDY